MLSMNLGLLALLGSTAALVVPHPAAPHPGFTLAVERREYNSSIYGLRKRSDGDDPVNLGGYWFSRAKAGGQDVDILLDTGSADLWLVGPKAPDGLKAGNLLYDPARSPTSRPFDGESFQISYGMGGNGFGGPVVKDVFCLGAACVNDMPIGTVDHADGFQNLPAKSGILGLGFKGGNSVRPDQQSTFMEQLQGSLQRPIFSTNFHRDRQGLISFGHVDSSQYIAPLQPPVKVDGRDGGRYPQSWSVENIKYSAGGRDLGTFDIIFDTGGPYTSGPENVVRAYYAQIPGARDTSANQDATSWTVPCDKDIPDLTISFPGGAVAIIPGKALKDANGNNNVCGVSFSKEGSASRGLMGTPFFAAHVVIFNQQDQTVQWAWQNWIFGL